MERIRVGWRLLRKVGPAQFTIPLALAASGEIEQVPHAIVVTRVGRAKEAQGMVCSLHAWPAMVAELGLNRVPDP